MSKAFDAFVSGYLTCMLFSSNDNLNESADNTLDVNYSIDDIAPEALKAARRQCWAFYRANEADLSTVDDYLRAECKDPWQHVGSERAGELFWYTRNGHGVGFWDHYKAEDDVAAAMDRLSEASKRAGDLCPIVGDDGQIWGLGEDDRPAFRITFSTLTQDSVSNGDHAEHGWMHDNGCRETDDNAPCPKWSLRDAVAFMADKCSHIETCWTPENNRLGMTLSGTGCTDDCEGDEIEVNYDLHISGVSDGTMMRLARLFKANGVYFANMFREPTVKRCKVCGGAHQHLYASGAQWVHPECNG